MPGVYLSDQELKQLVEVGIEACVVLSFTDIVGNHGSMVWICMQKCQEVSVENEDAVRGDFGCVVTMRGLLWVVFRVAFINSNRQSRHSLFGNVVPSHLFPAPNHIGGADSQPIETLRVPWY